MAGHLSSIHLSCIHHPSIHLSSIYHSSIHASSSVISLPIYHPYTHKLPIMHHLYSTHPMHLHKVTFIPGCISEARTGVLTFETFSLAEELWRIPQESKASHGQGKCIWVMSTPHRKGSSRTQITGEWQRRDSPPDELWSSKNLEESLQCDLGLLRSRTSQTPHTRPEDSHTSHLQGAYSWGRLRFSIQYPPLLASFLGPSLVCLSHQQPQCHEHVWAPLVTQVKLKTEDAEHV